jgi:hypothetical protein
MTLNSFDMNKSQQFPFMDISQLKEKFPNSWVLLFNTQNQPVGQLAQEGGFFAYKNKNRSKVYEKVQTLIPKGSTFTITYTGEQTLPDNTVLCL